MEKLLDIIDALLGPGGCPWDQKQTVESVRPSLHEEAHEVLDAIHRGDNAHLCEEVGDLLFNVVFLCRLAEKEGRFTYEEALESICEKLIRRHPHVFGDAQVKDEAGVVAQWEAIKQQERKGKEEHPFERLSRTLPALTRAKEVQEISDKKKISCELKASDRELEIGERLWELVADARASGVDPELALMKWVACWERGCGDMLKDQAGDLDGEEGPNQVRTGT